MNGNARQQFGLILLLTLACMGLGTGCGGYPAVSPEAYQLAKLLENACHAQKPEQLPLFRTMVEDQHAAGLLSPQERSWLLTIADTAADGNWEEAGFEIRRLMSDQNRAAGS